MLLPHEAIQFAPHLKGILARVLPILGNVRDIHRPVFANGMIYRFASMLLYFYYFLVSCIFYLPLYKLRSCIISYPTSHLNLILFEMIKYKQPSWYGERKISPHTISRMVVQLHFVCTIICLLIVFAWQVP